MKSIDSTLSEACECLQSACEEKTRCCEEAVRRSPLAAVGVGVLAGYLLQRLPLGALAAGAAGVALRLLKPALVIYGVLRAWECCRAKREATVVGAEEIS